MQLFWAIVRRLLYVIPLVWGVVTLTFVLVSAAPGDIVTAQMGDYPASEEYLQERRAALGIDQPVYIQYIHYVAQVFRGDLGFSFANREEVLPLVVGHLGATLLLVVAATLLALCIGLPVGLWAGTTSHPFFDRLTNVLTLLAFSIPTFWLALMGVLLFALTLGWLPTTGFSTIGISGGNLSYAVDVGKHLILPASVLAIPETALMIRMSRASATDTMNSGWVLTAVSKGMPRGRIIRRHVVRNSMLPVTTVLGYTFGTMIGGSVLIEKIFGWPGIGSLLYDSVQRRDTTVVLGVVVVVAVMTLVVNVLTDITYGLIDPRIREGGAL
ncbi:MAG: ABC transporter permease [Nostocoides sp.]